MASSNDCPQCFGNASSFAKLPACKTCQYRDACQYCAVNPIPDGSQRDTRGHHVSFEQYQHAEEIACEEKPYYDEPAPVENSYDKPLYSNADMQHMLEFMLRGVDDYSLAIVECVLREEHTTASQVAKAFGVSREAMHRKLIDSCRQYPYLAEMLRSTLYRCKMLADPARRGSIAGRRKRDVDQGQGEKKEQMEFVFDGEP